MSGHSKGRGSDTPLFLFRFLSSCLGSVSGILNGVGTLFIICLMVLINSDIAGRALFGAPVRGVPEMVSLSIVGIVFLQLAHTLRAGRLTRSDAFTRFLSHSFPRLAKLLDGLFNLAGLFFVGLLVKAGWPLFVKSWDGDVFIGSIGDFTAPVWPVKLIIVIGAAATGLQFLEAAIRCFYKAVSGSPPEKPADSYSEAG